MTSPSHGFVQESNGPSVYEMPSPFVAEGAVSNPVTERIEFAREQMRRQTQYLERLQRLAFDQSHPVDEYQSTPGIPQQWPGGTGIPVQFAYAIQLSPSYELPERIDSALWCLPPGIDQAWMKLADRWFSLYGAAAIQTPSVPADNIYVQNPYTFPVNVTITGGTVTAVFVNAFQVGSGDGTYLLPPGDAIAITYSVAPTWTWLVTPLSAPLSGYLNGLGVILNRDDDRLLLMNGTPTAGPTHFELMGYADEIYGNA